jgi:2-polyprenyl-3-methyl-5-hydroxy-6-metoxy-1,4-benzoquinol methylase
MIVEHCYAASYVDLKNESRFENRKLFFGLLLSLVLRKSLQQTSDHKLVLVDFGSAYGHLLDEAKKHGFQPEGVELNTYLIEHCRKRGLTAHPSLDDIASTVDVFTLIDSLYYVPNPKDVLIKMRSCLSLDGMLLSRVTNRNHYAKIRNFFIRDNDYSILGDATVSYSKKGIQKLLELTGYRNVAFIPDRAVGKQRLGASTWLIYKLSIFLYALSGGLINLSPGLIVLARPKQADE